MDESGLRLIKKRKRGKGAGGQNWNGSNKGAVEGVTKTDQKIKNGTAREIRMRGKMGGGSGETNERAGVDGKQR